MDSDGDTQHISLELYDRVLISTCRIQKESLMLRSAINESEDGIIAADITLHVDSHLMNMTVNSTSLQSLQSPFLVSKDEYTFTMSTVYAGGVGSFTPYIRSIFKGSHGFTGCLGVRCTQLCYFIAYLASRKIYCIVCITMLV